MTLPKHKEQNVELPQVDFDENSEELQETFLNALKTIEMPEFKKIGENMDEVTEQHDKALLNGLSEQEQAELNRMLNIILKNLT